jgi:hypothetical protein
MSMTEEGHPVERHPPVGQVNSTIRWVDLPEPEIQAGDCVGPDAHPGAHLVVERRGKKVLIQDPASDRFVLAVKRIEQGPWRRCP